MIRGCNKVVAGLVLLGLALFVGGCDKPYKAYRLSGTVADSGYSVVLRGSFDEAHLQMLEAGIRNTLKHIDVQMRSDNGESEFSLIKSAPPGQFLLLSAPVADMLRTVLKVMPLADDHDALALYGTALVKYRPTVLELGTFMEGFAADRVADYLNAQDVENYLVEIGGKIRSHGHAGGGQLWRMLVADFNSRETADTRQIIAFGDKAVATVSNYHRDPAQRVHAYMINAPAQRSTPVFVAVIAPLCVEADIWATTLKRLDVAAGLEAAEHESIAAYFVVQTAGGFEAVYSSAFKSYLGKTGEGERS